MDASIMDYLCMNFRFLQETVNEKLNMLVNCSRRNQHSLTNLWPSPGCKGVVPNSSEMGL